MFVRRRPKLNRTPTSRAGAKRGGGPPNAHSAALPFLKWPGGKRWAADLIATRIARRLSRRYYEPFLGGGAIFFRLAPEAATLCDLNGELIDVYRAIRDDWKQVVYQLQLMPVSKFYYDEVRSWRPRGRVAVAARFLYLNRTAFAGMYRLNREGNFNVPYGGGARTPAILWRTSLLEAAHDALQGISLRSCDFGSAINTAGRGDVVYCDPTYTVAHDTNGFVRYNERCFSWRDQQRLAKAAAAAQSRGAFVLVSNACHRSVRQLYPSAKASVIRRRSAISADPRYRREVSELLLTLEP